MKWNVVIFEKVHSGKQVTIAVYRAEVEAPDVIEAAIKAYGVAFEFGLERHEVVSVEQKGDE